MDRRLFIAGATGVMAGPVAARQHEGADGYAFQRKEYVRTRIVLTVTEYPSFAALRAALPPSAAPSRRDGRLKAWSVLHQDGSADIHIVDQAVSFTPDALGHELAHCIYGRWHD